MLKLFVVYNYRKSIVIGDKDEALKNEIHISELKRREESFDYGLDYYKIDLNKLGNYEKATEIIQILVYSEYNNDSLVVQPIFHAISSNKLYYNNFDPKNGAFSVSNITIKDGSFDKTQKEYLNDLLSTCNTSLEDELFIKITAKEYYSLLD